MRCLHHPLTFSLSPSLRTARAHTLRPSLLPRALRDGIKGLTFSVPPSQGIKGIKGIKGLRPSLLPRALRALRALRDSVPPSFPGH
jgi:hypothetical protein